MDLVDHLVSEEPEDGIVHRGSIQTRITGVQLEVVRKCKYRGRLII